MSVTEVKRGPGLDFTELTFLTTLEPVWVAFLNVHSTIIFLPSFTEFCNQVAMPWPRKNSTRETGGSALASEAMALAKKNIRRKLANGDARNGAVRVAQVRYRPPCHNDNSIAKTKYLARKRRLSRISNWKIDQWRHAQWCHSCPWSCAPPSKGQNGKSTNDVTRNGVILVREVAPPLQKTKTGNRPMTTREIVSFLSVKLRPPSKRREREIDQWRHAQRCHSCPWSPIPTLKEQAAIESDGPFDFKGQSSGGWGASW